MGWVPPPSPPISDLDERQRYRAYLVKVLGYDPAAERAPRFQTLRYIGRSLRRARP